MTDATIPISHIGADVDHGNTLSRAHRTLTQDVGVPMRLIEEDSTARLCYAAYGWLSCEAAAIQN